MKTFAKQCKLCMLAFKGKPRKPRRPLHFGLVAFGITLARVRSKFEFQGWHSNTKSQLISRGLFGVIVSTKKTTEFLQGFLP